jgi:hypothetical protein
LADPVAAIIIAYLTISDHQCGTFLLSTDQDGNIDIIFKTPGRRDIVVTDIQNDRRLTTKVFLNDRIFPPSNTYSNKNSFLVLQTNLRAVEDCTTETEHMGAQLDETERRLATGSLGKIGLLDLDIGHPELEARALAASQRLRIDPRYDAGKAFRVHADGHSLEVIASEL